MSKPTARAAGPVALSGAVTVITICKSPWWNLSVNSCVALADSEVGAWDPLDDGDADAHRIQHHHHAHRDDPPRRCDREQCDSLQHAVSSLYPRTHDQRQLIHCQRLLRDSAPPGSSAAVNVRGAPRCRSTKSPRYE